MGFVVLLFLPGGLHAQATAFFGASKPISSDADVWTAGTQIWALNAAASGTTVINGITFSAANPTAGSGGAGKTVYWGGASSAANNLLTFDTATGSLSAAREASSGGGAGTNYQNLSASYRSLVGFSTVGGNTGDVTLRGLTSGRAYILQAWSNSSDSTRSDNTRWMTNGVAEGTAISLGQHSALAVNRSNTVGGTGEFFIATFTAAGSTQDFDVACSNAARISAIQLRDVTGYWSGQTSGVWSSSAANFMGGMAFNNSQITAGGFAAFTDLGRIAGQETYNGAGGNSNRTVTLQRDVSIQSTGVSIGTVRLENNSDTYTFANASGSIGITGSTAVLKTGTGRVVFNSANTYSGATTVNAGTLVVNNASGSGTGSGTLTLAAGARLEGRGIIGGPAVISGTHAPGNSPGTQTFASGVEYTSTSIFEWELTSNTTAGRGTSWDAVNLTTGGTMTTHPDAIFRLVLDAAVDFSQAFWETNKSWDVFVASSGASISSVFQAFQVTGGSNYDAGLGSFSMNSSGTLLWTVNDGGGLEVIPEPSTLLVGLLLGAGLFRRTRPALMREIRC